MKLDPRYGYYPWWPQDGDDWIHPEDVSVARRMIPSGRIWRRDGIRGPFVVLHYGSVRLRVRPTLWIEVAGEGLNIGDWVEVLSRMQKNTYRIGTVREMFWDLHRRSIRYRIEYRRQLLPNAFLRDDLRPVESVPLAT